MSWLSNLCRLRRCTRGSAAAELALIMPVVMLLCAGIVEIGGVYQVYNATNQLASQDALAWADCSDSGTYCQTELNSYTSAASIQNLVPQLTAANLNLQMFEVLMSGSTPTLIYSGCFSGGAVSTCSGLSPAQTAAAQAQFSTGQYGVIVTATYVHKLQFFNTIMSPFLGSTQTASYTVLQIKN